MEHKIAENEGKDIWKNLWESFPNVLAALFGANASGKSNLVKSYGFYAQYGY